MKPLLDEVVAQADRLRPSRVGIADFAMRQHKHLGERLEAARALGEVRRDLTMRALQAQAEALLGELSRLSAPEPYSKEYRHGY